LGQASSFHGVSLASHQLTVVFQPAQICLKLLLFSNRFGLCTKVWFSIAAHCVVAKTERRNNAPSMHLLLVPKKKKTLVQSAFKAQNQVG
jgi:hypothetical protein